MSIWREMVAKLWAFIAGKRPLHYIGGAETLPPPLDPEEEAELLERLAEGDREAQNILIERNLRLVVYIARRFDNTRVPVEDLVSIGTIGLIKAVQSFNPAKKTKLATYASRCIENEILMYLRRTSKTRAEVSFEQPLNVDWDGNELLLADIHGTDPDVVSRNVEEEAEKMELWEALKKLSGRERTILELRFGLEDGVERTQKQVADRLGISQSYISRLEKRIMRRLRQELARAE
ncbi:MAG: RNA polymerase sporulation sigma factor SigE [Clostridiales bacterium]|nr:RNA polymerase sporulation sigma factor SigE [Clostridiales bacterium]